MSENTRVDSHIFHSPRDQSKYHLEHHVVECPVIGKINVYLQGQRTNNEVVIMTMHDLGCSYNMYQDFIDHPRMVPIRDRTVWLHLEVPGQSFNAPDLPADYLFPRMQVIAEDLIKVLDDIKIKEVVCFGEGAGANILARFAMANIKRVLGVCLLHATGTTAGLFESLKDKVMSWKLETMGMNSSAEHYLVLHRFGGTEFNRANDNEELKTIVESYQESLRNKINPKNLRQFVGAFLKRTNIADNIKTLKCPVLLVTGQHSIFNGTTRSLHQSILKTCTDKTKVEFIEVIGVANVLEEKPDKLAECFQYFLQGLGLVSSIPMHNVHKMLRNRTMSMEDYDRPKREQFATSNSQCTSFDHEGFQGNPPNYAANDGFRAPLGHPVLRQVRTSSSSPPGSPTRLAHPIETLAEEN